jgi:hypothetical protein
MSHSCFSRRSSAAFDWPVGSAYIPALAYRPKTTLRSRSLSEGHQPDFGLSTRTTI